MAGQLLCMSVQRTAGSATHHLHPLFRTWARWFDGPMPPVDSLVFPVGYNERIAASVLRIYTYVYPDDRGVIAVATCTCDIPLDMNIAAIDALRDEFAGYHWQPITEMFEMSDSCIYFDRPIAK